MLLLTKITILRKPLACCFAERKKSRSFASGLSLIRFVDMEYFTIEELCASETARSRGIANRPTEAVRERLVQLIENLLDPLRAAWGAPIAVNSGYRCPQLNAAVGGVSTSQHLKGEAADITAGSPTANRRLFATIRELHRSGRLVFDQLIDEADYRWIHISYRAGANRGQVLHL